MAKKKVKATATAAKAAKKAKAAQKVEKKTAKKAKSGRAKEEEDSDDDLEAILDNFRREWEQAHAVTEELVEGPPSRRANATLTACPNGNHLWCIGGEWFSEDGRAHFYNDTFRYSPEKDEWRKFVSPTCPGPRSAHAVAATATGGGKLFLFGGEFSSLHQTTFHHYRDFWCFDISTHSWERVDTKVMPSARSGCRMVVWKHYILLFGGFYDPGVTTRYLNDLWIFDTHEYKWRQVEFRENEPKPSPRSGFSFLSTPEGIILHGGYCKEYVKGKRPVGVMLDDTWLLKLTLADADSNTTPDSPANPKSPVTPLTSKSRSSKAPSKSKTQADPLQLKWERRKRPSTAYAPALRSGCTMTAWTARGMGVMFGGVTDEDKGEEGMDSVFWADLNAYQWGGKGRWISLTLKRPKKKGGGGNKKKKKQAQAAAAAEAQRKKEEAEEEGKARIEAENEDVEDKERDDDDDDEDDETSRKPAQPFAPQNVKTRVKLPTPAVTNVDPNGDEVDPEDPSLTVPLPRYNAMLAVLRDTLYIYGGIFERGSREYTLDDFYSIQLDKMDRFTCLKESGVIIEEGEDESSDDDEGDGDDDDEESGSDDEGEGNDGGEGEEDEERSKENKAKNIRPRQEEREVEEEEQEDEEEAEPDTLRLQAQAFMGVSKDAARSPEDVTSTPLPGETLAMFYARSREYWSRKAHGTGSSEHRGKMLRRDGFALAEERYAEYKPILREVEKILAEAGLDEEEMKRSAAAGATGGSVASGQSRNRRHASDNCRFT
ncbi:galactose oxidase [Marasmius fiardii PR-910]|nr:galactose oxidase [Marasmius fiardii PR-910]